jgi:flagellar hook assembly protein FlgD
MTYLVEPDGPGITWCQLVNAVPPADVYYVHKDSLAGIAEDDIGTPSTVALHQNMPNPFSHKTVIRFSIPNRGTGNLTIYDAAGRKVKQWHLAPSHLSGTTGIVWDGKDLHGNEVPGGVYLYTLSSGAYSATKKLILVK